MRHCISMMKPCNTNYSLSNKHNPSVRNDIKWEIFFAKYKSRHKPHEEGGPKGKSEACHCISP